MIGKSFKVGILSMQRIFNYGSFLQGYGLKSILKELGCDVQFVDYHPGKCLIPPDGGVGIMRKISKVSEVFRYHAPLKEKIRFIRYKKNYAAKFYPYLEITNQMNYAPQLDLLVIGSDEVFNCVQSNTNVGFSPELFGAEQNAKKIISYAASFGNTTLEQLKKYQVDEKISGWLKNFTSLSVRDMNSGRIVKKLTGKEPAYHLDPVLMYDFIGKCRQIPEQVSEKNYMILYGYSGRFSSDECAAIRSYADSKGLKIFCIGGVQNCCDKFINCNPFEVIAYFQHASAVVTDTFHGTILSVITHRNFAVFVRRKAYGNSEKLTDLLERLKLNERMVEKIENLAEMLDVKIDYSGTDSILAEQREISYNYLRSVLDLIQ